MHQQLIEAAESPVTSHNIRLPWRTWHTALSVYGFKPSFVARRSGQIRDGWPPGIPPDAEPVSCSRNYIQTPQEEEAVYKDCIKGLNDGWLLGPFSLFSARGASIIRSPLQTAPKPGGLFRIIHNLSFGKSRGTSVNSFIPESARYVRYVDTYDIVAMLNNLGSGAWIWIIDMADAYRRVLVQPKFHRFLGFQWAGYAFCFACLPFGMSSSCQIYSDFAETVRQLLLRNFPSLFLYKGKHCTLNYLDDFFGGHPTFMGAWLQCVVFVAWLNLLGIPARVKKVHFPDVTQIILGFLYDMRKRRLSVPSAKIDEILNQILVILNQPKCSRRQLASVVGKLLWASQVIEHSRAFLNRLEHVKDLNISWDAQSIRLNRACRSDLLFFTRLLKSLRNGVSFDFILSGKSQATLHVYTDAAGAESTGFGAFASDRTFFACTWSSLCNPSALPWDAHKGSTAPEFFGLLVAHMYYATRYRGKSILYHCDNSGVVGILTKNYTTPDKAFLLRALRHFRVVAFENRVRTWIDHIPGDLNTVADNLSRAYSDPVSPLCGVSPVTNEFVQPFFDANPSVLQSSDFVSVDVLPIAVQCLSILCDNCDIVPSSF